MEKYRSLTWCRYVLVVMGSWPVLAQVPLNLNPQRAVGNATLRQSSIGPNLVEGRELNQPLNVTIDATRNILWVSDTNNNRVLGWRNANAFDTGAQADFVLGQRDFLTTDPQGPATTFSAGLFGPTGVAVDASGNVYVLDGGNNRVLRYPRPFDQQEQLPDLVIGQPDFRSRNPNAGLASPTEKTIVTFTGSAYKCNLAFDSQNNLWVVDPGNNRLLRFGSNVLGTDAPSYPSANLVVGQPDFSSSAPVLAGATTLETRIKKTGLREPSSLAFDQAGRLIVTDYYSRALVYRPPFANGMNASRIMGIAPAQPEGQPALTPINEYTLGVTLSNNTTFSADGVFTAGNTIFIIDTPVGRILRFEPVDSWPAESVSFSPRAQAVIGQDGFTQTQLLTNRGQPEPSGVSFSSPNAGVYANGETYIVDTGNNRVLAFGDLTTGPAAAAGSPYSARRVLGQDNFFARAVNLIEGREFSFNYAGATGGGVRIDSRSNPPRLYVADTLNNRVLGFADARRVREGSKADVVIGQPDFSRSVLNFPSNDLNTRGPSSLALPTDVAVDSNGNVWVADAGNSRVLRFPDPFANPGAPADLVIGQTGFSTKLQDATSRTMSTPYGLAFSFNGALFVSDNALHRVLQFNPPFSNGMAASRAFGQPDFSTSTSGTADNKLSGPRHISFDSDDRLYVADTGNNRIQIFSRAPIAGADPRAAYSLTRNLNRPFSVFVSLQSGDIWVGNSGAGNALRYPNFDRLVAGGDNANYQVPAAGPVGLTLDPFGNLYMADLRNRVVIHYPQVTIVNGANYLSRIAPAMAATLLCGNLNYAFTADTAVNDKVPVVRELSDLRVTIEGQTAPLYFVSPFQINFQVPKRLPTSGSVQLQVEQISTGRIVAATDVAMSPASPGLFTLAGTGTGQLAAINVEDGNSINGVGTGLKPVGRGKIIALYGTGQGLIDNLPEDGVPPSGPVPTDGKPFVVVAGKRLDDADILYSGLAPGLVGVWQLNIRIPDTVPPSSQAGPAQIVLLWRDVPSNNPQNPQQIVTTVQVQ